MRSGIIWHTQGSGKTALAEMSKEGAALDKAIAANLKKLELVK